MGNMAPATQFPSTIRDYVQRGYLRIETVHSKNLLVIPDEAKIQEAYKRGDTTSDNNAFCAFKKQLCEYGFSAVARKDWPEYGIESSNPWVYEHSHYNLENCLNCNLKKPGKPITVRFTINPETGEVQWPNANKTIHYAPKLIECIEKASLKRRLFRETTTTPEDLDILETQREAKSRRKSTLADDLASNATSIESEPVPQLTEVVGYQQFLIPHVDLEQKSMVNLVPMIVNSRSLKNSPNAQWTTVEELTKNFD